MKLEANLTEEQFGTIHEDIQENYTKVDDGYVLTIEGMTNEDVSGLKSALAKEKERRKTAETNIETVQREKDELRASISTSEHDTHRYKKRFYAAKRDAGINEAIAMAAGNTQTLSPLLREHVKVIENENGHIEYQVHKNGTAMLKDDGSPVSIDDYVQSLKGEQAWKGSFRGTGSNGGGSDKAESGTPISLTPRKRRSLMTNVEKVDFINEHGDTAFHALPW